MIVERLKFNIAANFLAQGWRILMALAFVPLYIKYLGIEAYGLIGIFAVLQGWLGLLDLGMRPALAREMARFTGGALDGQSICDLLRSIELVSLVLALLVAIGVWASSGWLAANWIRAEMLPVDEVSRAVSLMGMVAALQFLESVYTSSINGLQRQVLQNGITSLMATVRGAGAVGILIWVSPTINAFFVWQGLMSLFATAVFGSVVHRVLPSPPRPARFSLPALTSVWRYAAGMVGITLLGLLLTQVDKILLSRMLALEMFAHYALAGVLASSLFSLAGLITSAYFPRFTELVVRHDAARLRLAYHQAAQLVSVLVGTAALGLILFSEQVLLLWTGDLLLVSRVAPLLSILALGAMLNAVMWIPYHLQLAHGWTSLTFKVNCISVAIIVPAILWVVPLYGARGAAWVSVALNAGYILFVVSFMHRRLLIGEKMRWYVEDLAMPLVAGALAGLACRWLLPAQSSFAGNAVSLAFSLGFILFASALSASTLRGRIVMLAYGAVFERYKRCVGAGK